MHKYFRKFLHLRRAAPRGPGLAPTSGQRYAEGAWRFLPSVLCRILGVS